MLDTRRLMTLSAALIPLLVGVEAGAVRLTISSANVGQAGDMARLCVTLDTEGEEVAGTQNDLVWDGNCMTLTDGACVGAGSHGKQVHPRIQNSAEFRMRLLVLSLSDVDPIEDGILYCCTVQSEAAPGSCCNISVVNAAASDSGGKAVAGVSGNSGRVCAADDGRRSGGAIGGIAGGQASASGGAPAADVAPPAPAQGEAAAPAPAAAAPAAQALQGGGGGVQGGGGGVVPPTIAAPADEEPAPVVAVTPAAAPTAAAAPAAPAAPAPAPATLAATAAAVPSEAATAAATAADTATPEQPTAAPTTAAPASTPTAPRSTPTAAGSGWFGCQIDAAASPAPPLVLAGLLAALAVSHRLRRRRR